MMCAVCGVKTSLDRNAIANKEVACRSCINEAKLTAMELLKLRKMTADELKNKINNMDKNDPTNFNTTKKIGSYVSFDDNKGKWGIPKLGVILPQNLYDYKDVVGVELIEDGRTLNKGGIGRALVGGVLLGSTGAIVGAVTRKSKDVCKCLRVKVTTRNMNDPAIFITLISKSTKKDSAAYKSAYQKAQECVSAFQLICDRNS